MVCKVSTSVIMPNFLAAILIPAFVLGTLNVATAAPRRRSHSMRQAPAIAEKINALARQLYGVPYYEAGPIPEKIQKLVYGALTTWLSRKAAWNPDAAYPIDVRVRTQLANYFSELRYPWSCQPVVFARPWEGSELIGAGYSLSWSQFDSVNSVALYVHRAGETTMAAQTDFVPQTDLHYAFLPPGPDGDFRFFVYGSMAGKSQPRLTAILYSFNGKTVKNVWEKQKLYDGKIEVTPNTVTFRYLIEQEYVQAVEQNQLPPGHESVYRVTPKGLQLETEQVIPFQVVNSG